SFPTRRSSDLNNLPSIKFEKNIHNIKNYLSVLKCELTSVNFPNRPIENFSKTWEDVVKTIYENDKFGKQLKIGKYFEEDLKEVILGIDDEKLKISAILNFVQNRMKWNGKNGVLSKDGVKNAYKNKTGNV